MWIWADGPWRPVRRFVDAAQNVTALAFNPQGTVLAIGAHAEVLVLTDEVAWTRCATFDPSGRYLAATGEVVEGDDYSYSDPTAEASVPGMTVRAYRDGVLRSTAGTSPCRTWPLARLRVR